MRKVVVSGIGIVSPFGNGTDIFWKGISKGKTAARLISAFDASDFPTRFCANVPLGDTELDALIENQKTIKTLSRPGKLAIIAVQEAVKHSGIDPDRVNNFRFGTSIGAAGLGLTDIDYTKNLVKLVRDSEAGKDDFFSQLWYGVSRKLHPMTPLKNLSNIPTAQIAIKYKAMGECLTVTTACTSSSQAIGEAYRKIKYGILDAAICGGSDSMTSPFGVSAFSILGVMSKNNDEYLTACRPFDKTRDGFMLGEGSAMFVIEEYEHCIKRGGTIFAEIIGYASTNDAFRLTDEPPDAAGSVRAMQNALKDASISAEDIDYINAHGTGTKMNDKTETYAIKRVFGEHSKSIPVSSTKSMIGHLIAAAGAIEFAACVLALQYKLIPPTINYRFKDEECNLDYVPNTAREVNIRTVLSNSFGFGGQNSCLILKSV